MKTTGSGWRRFKRYLPLFLMALPGVTYLIINNYLPMSGLIVAFKDYNVRKGIWGSEWIGFKNFEYLFKTQDAWNITRNTIFYNLTFIALVTLLAVTLAVCLNEVKNKHLSRFFQTVFLLPHLVSMITVAYLTYAFLSQESGWINSIIKRLGGDPIAWYTESKYWPFILTIVYVWKQVGYSTILYYASIVGVDRSYYEAAALDGATKWQQVCRITVPLISPVIIMMVLLNIGKIFYSDFGLFYQVPMQSGPLLDITSTIDTYVYRGLMKLGDIGMSGAASFYQSVVGFITIFVCNWIVKKRSPENSLF